MDRDSPHNGRMLPYSKELKMRRITIALAFLLAFSVSAAAQEDEAAVRAQINRSASLLETLEGRFTQTKYMSMLDEKMTSQGIIYYAKGNKLRWEYRTPYKYTFILNGSTVVLETGERSDAIDVNQSKVFKEIARIMMNSVTGHCIDDGRDFEVSISSSDGQWVATLVPLNRNLRSLFDTLVLHYDRSAAVVTKVELLEKNGDRTVIELQDIKTNRPLDESVFNVN